MPVVEAPEVGAVVEGIGFRMLWKRAESGDESSCMEELDEFEYRRGARPGGGELATLFGVLGTPAAEAA